MLRSILIIFIVFAVLCIGYTQNLFAMDMHQMMHHEKMQEGDLDTSGPIEQLAKLGPAKKPVVKSKKKKYFVVAENLPISAGNAIVQIKVQRATKRPVSGHTQISGELYMPGMKMDIPPVKVTAKGDGTFQLEFSIPMEGYWKIKLTIQDVEKDMAILKFITK